MKVNYANEIVHNALIKNNLGVLTEQDYTPLFFSETIKINGVEKVEAGTCCYAKQINDIDIEKADERGRVAFKIRLLFLAPEGEYHFSIVNPDDGVFDSEVVECSADETGHLLVCGKKNILIPADGEVAVKMTEYREALFALRQKNRVIESKQDVLGWISLSIGAFSLIYGVLGILNGYKASDGTQAIMGVAALLCAVLVPLILLNIFGKDYEETARGKKDTEYVKELFDWLCESEGNNVKSYKDADMCVKAGSRVVFAPTDIEND